MRPRFIGAMAATVALVSGLLLMRGLPVGESTAASAQAAGVPRTADGKPDLSGIWQALNSAWWDLEDHGARPGVPAGQAVVQGGTIPYQSGALARRQENFTNRATLDPETKCFLAGVPRITYVPFPFQIIQTPERVSLLYEYAHTTRIVYTNGTMHPEGNLGFWMGDSRGRWEGDTLVVDVTHFNDETWFDRVGNFHSDALHVVERYTLVTPDHIDYEATIEDAKVFTGPWTIRLPLYRRKDANMQLLEYECHTFERWPTETNQ
jgi:hypothetical protein